MSAIKYLKWAAPKLAKTNLGAAFKFFLSTWSF